MSVRFDAAARRAIDGAMVEMERREHRAIDSRHLLVALLAPRASAVRTVLDALGVDGDALLRRAAADLDGQETAGAGPRSGEAPGAAERVLEGAHRISAQYGHAEVTDVDILLSCAQDGATRAGVLLGAADASAARLWTVYANAGERLAAPAGPGAVPGVRRPGPVTSPAVGLPRAGVGYDSHRFGPGGPLVLGGVRIDADRRLVGHSDGDAVAHALTDAVLGAAGAGDIGEMFSDQDPANRGADSIAMLAAAVARVRALGYSVHQVDVTVVAEWPKIGPHRAAMRVALARALEIDPGAVSVKGKSNEGMGWVGREEGLACIAVATLAPAASAPPR